MSCSGSQRPQTFMVSLWTEPPASSWMQLHKSSVPISDCFMLQLILNSERRCTSPDLVQGLEIKGAANVQQLPEKSVDEPCVEVR